FDPAIGTASHEDGDMKAAGATYAGAGGYFRHDARGSGCKKGATWCVHMTLVTNKPHDPGDAKEIDFADFEGREVTHAYLDAKASEAGVERGGRAAVRSTRAPAPRIDLGDGSDDGVRGDRDDRARATRGRGRGSSAAARIAGDRPPSVSAPRLLGTRGR